MTHWLIISIISAGTWGIVSVLDKRILNSYIVSPIIYFSWIGLISILYSIILFIFIPFTSSYTIEFLWPLFAGMIWGIGIIILFQALKKEDSSNIIPLYYTHPIISVLIALLFLNETINNYQIIGISLTMIGTIIIASQKFKKNNKLKNFTPIILAIAAGIFIGIAMVLNKIGLEKFEISETFILRNIGFGIIGLLVMKQANITFFKKVFKQPKLFKLLLFTNLIWGPLAVIIHQFALNSAPITLVTPILATTPLFTFLLSSILSMKRLNILQESITTDTLIRKGLGALIIVTGIIFIQL